jgi:hypothetical protein
MSGYVEIGLEGEDGAHVVLVQTLARRVALEHVEWLAEEDLDVRCRWTGPRGDSDFKLPKDFEYAGSGRKFRIHGKIGGEPLLPEARRNRRILIAFEQLVPAPEIVIIARDGDGRTEERRAGFDQVVGGARWSFAVVLALPEPESEAWFICGFEPVNDHERRRHGELRQPMPSVLQLRCSEMITAVVTRASKYHWSPLRSGAGRPDSPASSMTCARSSFRSSILVRGRIQSRIRP